MYAGLTAFAAAAAAAADKKAGLPQLHLPDFAPQLIWLALTFGLLYFLLSRVALPRVGEVIEERGQRIRRDLDEAARLKGDTEKALAAYEQSLAEARSRAGGIAKETRDRLAREVEAERTRVDQQVAVKVGEAEKRIGDMKSKALAQVRDIAAETAGAIVIKLTGQAVTVDEARRAMKPVVGG